MVIDMNMHIVEGDDYVTYNAKVENGVPDETWETLNREEKDEVNAYLGFYLNKNVASKEFREKHSIVEVKRKKRTPIKPL